MFRLEGGIGLPVTPSARLPPLYGGSASLASIERGVNGYAAGHLQKNCRICFFGDSITAAGLWIREFTDYLLTYHRDKRISALQLRRTGGFGQQRRAAAPCGLPAVFSPVCGDHVWYERYRPGLYSSENPDERTGKLPRERLDLFRESLRRILDGVREVGAEAILCTPTPYDNWSEKEEPNLICSNQGLEECRRIVYALGDEDGVPVVDFFTAFMSYREKHPEIDLIQDDRVHPNTAGHQLMTRVFLRELGCLPHGEEELNLILHPANAERFRTEQLLRDISFLEWCLFYDVQGSWEEGHTQQQERIQKALNWRNAYADHAVEVFLQHKTEQDERRERLLCQTLSMYKS